MKKIVVTGAAGFIGSHLVRSLLSNPDFEVIGIDNLQPAYGGNWSKVRYEILSAYSNFTFLELDLFQTGADQLKGIFEGAYSVIHLAAWPGVRASQEIPFEYSKANLTGFTNILEAVRIAQPRQFLFASSSSVYGDLGSGGPVKESDATGKNVKSYYAATKWVNEILAQSYASISEVPTAGLRFFTVYGEGGRPDMAYWTFLEKINAGKPINLYGQTGGSRNFTYIQDAIEILLRLIDCNLPEYIALNIAAGEPISTIEFVRSLAKIANRELIINVVERPGVDVEKTWADLSALTSLLGVIKPTPTDIGLKNFYSWYTENSSI